MDRGVGAAVGPLPGGDRRELACGLAPNEGPDRKQPQHTECVAEFASERRSRSAPKPAKGAGEKVVDDGDGGAKVAAFLVAHKLI